MKTLVIDVSTGDFHEVDMSPEDIALQTADAQRYKPAPPKSITRSQAALELCLGPWGPGGSHLITKKEAKFMTTRGDPPSFLVAMWDQLQAAGQISADDRDLMELQFARDTYEYDNSLLSQLLVAIGATEEQKAAFFFAASKR